VVIEAWKITQKFVTLKFNMKMAVKLYKRWKAGNRLQGSVARAGLLAACGLWLAAFVLHPYYMSVTEMEYKATEKEVQISSKIFIDDLEYALEQEFKTDVAILQAADKKKNEALLSSFFQKHLKLTIDGKPAVIELIGFEREEEAIWSFLVVKNVNKLKTVTVFNDLLYTFRQDQINIIHFKKGDNRKSHRFTHPDTQVRFSW
jgi:hypothetical protein